MTKTTRLLLCLCAPMVLSAQNNLTTTVTERFFNGVRKNLEGAADAMPEAKYSYKLTDGQMSFAEWLNHATQRNFTDCATLKGEPAPEASKKVSGLTSKAEVSRALKDSFTYCAAVLSGLDDKQVLASPQTTYALLHIAVHNNEIYGNLAGYLRSSGIVPPSTASRAGQKSKKQ